MSVVLLCSVYVNADMPLIEQEPVNSTYEKSFKECDARASCTSIAMSQGTSEDKIRVNEYRKQINATGLNIAADDTTDFFLYKR